MAVANKSAHGQRGRQFSFEPLEDRSLLSGFTAPSQPDSEAVSPSADVQTTSQDAAPSSREGVQVVEITPADEDEADDDSAREIAVEELPRQVVAAMTARFPGARLVAAEMNSDDGSLVFDVSGEWGGVELEVALSPDGAVMQVGQSLASADLPQPLRDWLASNFPGALIREAELVTADGTVSYELLFATSAEQAFEAVLRVAGGDTSGVQALPDAIGEPVFFVSESIDDLGARRFAQAFPDDDSLRDTENHSAAAETETLSSAVLMPGPAATETGPQVAQRGAAEVRAESSQEPQGERLTDSDQVTTLAVSVAMSGTNRQLFLRSATLPPVVSTIASAIPATWLPQLAQALVDVFPFDTSALERSMQQFLDEVDSLTDKVASGSMANQLAPRLLIAVATLAGAERLITQMNRAKRDPVLSSAGGKSTWTWVLNLGGTE